MKSKGQEMKSSSFFFSFLTEPGPTPDPYEYKRERLISPIDFPLSDTSASAVIPQATNEAL